MHPTITHGQAARVRAIERRCRGPLDPAAAAERDRLLAISPASDATRSAARAADAAGRAGCGADINDLILSFPLDRGDYAAACPECGQMISWTAPDGAALDALPSPA